MDNTRCECSCYYCFGNYSLIRGEVVCQNLAKEGALISKETAAKNFEEEFSLTQTEKSQENVYTVLQQVLNTWQVTTEEYVELGKAQGYVFYNMKLAKENFKNGSNYHSDSSESLDKQWESYVNDLVKLAKVQQVSEEM